MAQPLDYLSEPSAESVDGHAARLNRRAMWIAILILGLALSPVACLACRVARAVIFGYDG